MAAQALKDLEGMSYEEYISRIDEMADNLRAHWKLEERVNALKIAIQLSKLLSDTSQLKLYSKKYKMVTNILDEFGKLIHIRIQSKAFDINETSLKSSSISNQSALTYQDGSNSTVISLTDLDQARETCRNWFLKVASIRELVPRFYAELSILRTCDILFESTSARGNVLPKEQLFVEPLNRLTKAAWGFGDPIVAIHARIHLCKVAERLITWNPESNDSALLDLVSMNLDNSLTLVARLDSATIMRTIRAQMVDTTVVFDLLSNALQSIINFITQKCDAYSDGDHISQNLQHNLQVLFAHPMRHLNQILISPLSSSIIMHSTLKAFPSDLIADHSMEFVTSLQVIYERYLQSSVNEEMTMIAPVIYTTIGCFALALDESDAFEASADIGLRENILKSVLEILENIFVHDNQAEIIVRAQYLRCFAAWLSYANHYVDSASFDVMLNKFTLRIKIDRHYANHFQILLDLIKSLLTNKRTLGEFQEIFSLKSFSQLLELLRKDDHRLEAVRWILETMRASLKLNKNCPGESEISNKRSINFMIRLFSTMNDSLSVLTATDEIEHLSQLVIYFLNKISIKDHKELLDFYSRCRESLGNLNPVLEYLARRVLELPMDFRAVNRKRNQRQNFLNSCLAYTFTTLPALNDPFDRLELYIEGSRLALSQMSISLADYYLKQAISELTLQLQPKFEETKKISVDMGRHLRDLFQSLVDLVLQFEDHIDLEHKLNLTSLITSSNFKESPSLFESLKRLNTINNDSDTTI